MPEVTVRIRKQGYTRWFVRFVPERIRWAHRWYAQTHGYFWLPCILCGQESGGHEWRDIDGEPAQVPDPTRGPTAGIGICPWCTRAGKGSYALTETLGDDS